jgi:hypothetical protein
MRRLLEMDFTNLTATGDVNPHIKESTVSVIGSRGIDSEAEFDSAIANTDAPIPARRAGIELIIGIGTRMRNQNVYNFFIVVLSLLALASNMTESMWHLMCSMGALFSKSWTIVLARDLGDQLSTTRPNGSSTTIGFGVSDNKAYFVKTAHVHAHGIEGADDPRRANGEFLYTVNNLQVPLILGKDINIERGY